MARDALPTDEPPILDRETRYSEADAPWNASRMTVQPGQTEKDRLKGNLGNTSIPGLPVQSLSHPGTPFADLKGGR